MAGTLKHLTHLTHRMWLGQHCLTQPGLWHGPASGSSRAELFCEQGVGWGWGLSSRGPLTALPRRDPVAAAGRDRRGGQETGAEVAVARRVQPAREGKGAGGGLE